MTNKSKQERQSSSRSHLLLRLSEASLLIMLSNFGIIPEGCQRYLKVVLLRFLWIAWYVSLSFLQAFFWNDFTDCPLDHHAFLYDLLVFYRLDLFSFHPVM